MKAFLIIAVLATLPAMACMAIAEHKGYSVKVAGILCFLTSLLYIVPGLIVIIIYALMPFNRPNNIPPPPPPSDLPS